MQKAKKRATRSGKSETPCARGRLKRRGYSRSQHAQNVVGDFVVGKGRVEWFSVGSGEPFSGPWVLFGGDVRVLGDRGRKDRFCRFGGVSVDLMDGGIHFLGRIYYWGRLYISGYEK